MATTASMTRRVVACASRTSCPPRRGVFLQGATFVRRLTAGVVLALAAGFAIVGSPVTAYAADDGITVEVGAQSDQRVASRLQEILSEIAALDDITVAVNAGVVELVGKVNNGDERERAVKIAERIEGVVAVEDGISVSNEVAPRIESALQTGLDRLTVAASYLPLLAIALLILAIFYFVARSIWSSKRLFNRSVNNPFLGNLVRQIAGFAVLIIGMLVALELLDATAIVGAVLGAAGVAGLAIGFAFRDTIENYIAGILLSLRQPFSPHDHVAVEGYEGHVARLTSRATVLVTLDGNYVRIPNAKVFQGVLVNYSRNPLRRFGFQVGIGTDVDITAAQELAHRTLGAMAAVLNDPEPLVTVAELGDSNIIIDIKAWVDQREVSFGKVRSEAIRQIKEHFEDAEFDMPEPIYRLRVSSDSTGIRLDDGDTKPSTTRSAPRSTKATMRAVDQGEPDVSPERHMVEQVEEERRRDETEDLLDDSAPQE